MKRRNFIKFTIFSSMLLSSNVAIARIFDNSDMKFLDEIYQILFPKTKNMPSSQEFGALDYLIININHKTFNDEDKSYLTKAIKDFKNAFPNFLDLKKEEKLKLIKDATVNSNYAYNFISKLSYYGIEAMFSDPIYGGNKNQIGWNSVNHYYGRPRPKTKYGKKYDL